MAITELTEIFATSLRVNESFKHILEGVQKYFGFDRARLYLVNKDANKLQGELSVDNIKDLTELMRVKQGSTAKKVELMKADLLMMGEADQRIDHGIVIEFPGIDYDKLPE